MMIACVYLKTGVRDGKANATCRKCRCVHEKEFLNFSCVDNPPNVYMCI